MATPEQQIPPPVNPLTVKLNLTVLHYAFDVFMQKYLPLYDAVITSDYRTPAQNEKAGGAPNSAHLHGLALDFALKYKAGGQAVPESNAKAVYDQYVAPFWWGFSEWEASSPGEGYHIHVNLSREITTYAGLMAVAGAGVLGFALISAWRNQA